MYNRRNRPIGLCNTIYKIITKIIANRIKSFIQSIIEPSQASFIANRRASDHAIVVQEIMSHFGKMKGKTGCMTLKIDLEKTFDRIEWSYIKDTRTFFNFPHNLAKLIMSCVSSSSIQVLINDRKTNTFLLSREIRQGDMVPLSVHYVHGTALQNHPTLCWG